MSPSEISSSHNQPGYLFLLFDLGVLAGAIEDKGDGGRVSVLAEENIDVATWVDDGEEKLSAFGVDGIDLKTDFEMYPRSEVMIGKWKMLELTKVEKGLESYKNGLVWEKRIKMEQRIFCCLQKNRTAEVHALGVAGVAGILGRRGRSEAAWWEGCLG